jgi:hypothetical protein
MDNLRDEWAGGRMFFLLPQYWSQRNYTDEDRYAFRTTVTDAYWRFMYLSMMNLETIIRMNEDPETQGVVQLTGDNASQIAAAMILKCYVFSNLTDQFGDIPFSEAFLGNENRQPKFDKQSDIYPKLLEDLETAVNMIPADGIINFGDIIYNGDMTLWKKFGNSLRLRLAQRMANVDGGTALTSIVNSVGADGFFTSNAESAKFAYVGAGDNGPLYDAWFIENRNDFTLSQPFVNLLKGISDEYNDITNPFEGILDPRLALLATPVDGEIVGMPYGMTDAETQAFAPTCPDFKENPSPVHSQTYAYPFMDYAEVCFILSEYNGWDQTWYEKGIRANMEDWGVASADIDAYLADVPPASMENVLTQKYIAFYVQGEQAWAEWRRNGGYPRMIIHPGMQTSEDAGGAPIYFENLEGTDIPRRMMYPIEEQNINEASYDEAVANMGGDNMDVRVWWDTK